MRIDIPKPRIQEILQQIPKDSVSEPEYLYLTRVLEMCEKSVYVNSRTYLHEQGRVKTMTDEKLRARLERISSRSKIEVFIFALIESGKYDVLKHALKHRVYRKDLK